MLLIPFLKYISSVIMVFSLMLLPATSFGQTKNYTFKAYGVQDGLSSSAVYDVLLAKDGYIWFGTDVGISKFDGYGFKNFTQKDGITDNTVFKLVEDPVGRIWYLPFSGEIGYIADDKVYAYPYRLKLKQVLQEKDWFIDLKFYEDGEIEFFSYRGMSGFINRIGDITLKQSTRTNLNSLIITEGNEGVSANWLFGNDTSQAAYSSALIFDDIENKLDSIPFRAFSMFNILFNDTNGLAFSCGKILGYRKNGQIIQHKYDEMPSLIRINQAGEAWVSYRDKGVYVYKSFDDFFNYKEPEIKLFENINVSDVLHGAIGDAWITTEYHGAFYIFNRRIINYTINSNTRNRITAVVAGLSKDLFYGNENGEIYRIDSLNNSSRLASGLNSINQIICQDSNRLLISTSGGTSELVFHDRSYTCFIRSARTTFVTQDNVIWSTPYADLIAEKGGELIFSSSRKKEYTFFYCIYEDLEGQLWFGAKTGLYNFKNNELVARNDLFGSSVNPEIHDIEQLKDGTYLLATQRGLYCSAFDKEPQKFVLIGLSSHDIKKIAIDKEETIWLCTNKGLLRITHKNKKLVELYNLSSRIGLPSDEINDIAIIEDEVFAATNKGLAQFNKKAIVKNEILPVLHVNTITVNKKKINRNSNENYVLEYDQNYIQFDFVGLNYRSLGKVSYSYRLDGIDQNWQHSKSRSVRYPLLSPGAYCFRLRVANEDHVWSPEKRITFEIKLPFWQKWWFMFLVSLFALLILIFISLNIRDSRNKKFIRIREIEIQKRKVIEAELKALRAQMNPHFTFNTLNSIQNSINNFDQKNALKYITNYSLLLRKVLENSRHLYVTVAEEIEMLNLYLGLENLRFDNSIEYDFRIDENINPQFHEIPSMIIQPMVENSIVHGLSGKQHGEKKVTISLALEDDRIICIVEDTGIGRAKSAEIGKMKKLKKKSLGMQITKERLELFYKEKGNDLAFIITDLFDKNGTASGTSVKIIFTTKKHPKL